ncbi:MAG: hypothetical protein Q8P22_05300, partial [Chloroflexota bacterium]|nr:hypothetical protein [Chloroflexota bacterium]
QIRQLAHNLLELHMGEAENEKIDEIVATLAEKLYSHGHMISRREAAQIGLKVAAPSPALDRAMWSLFDAYVEDLNMFDPFNPDVILGSADSSPILIERAFIESASHTDVFISEGSVRRLPAGPPTAGMPPSARIQLPPGVTIPQVAVDLSFEGWRPVR